VKNQILSELEKLESLQIFTKEDWLEKLYRKSKSEGSRAQGNSALNCFADFCEHNKKTEEEIINKYKILSKSDSPRNLGLALDRFVQFMTEDHDDIEHLDPLQEVKRRKDPKLPEKWLKFKKKNPKTNKNIFGFVKSYLRQCHDIRISNEDVNDFITFPKGIKISKQPVTIEVLKIILNNSSPLRRTFYNVLVTSGMRLGEGLQLVKNDFHLDENPVRITIRGETTKTREGRDTFISSEAVDKLKPIIADKEDNDKIFLEDLNLKRSKNIKQAVTHEDHVFSDLRKRLALKDKRFKEKYPHNNRYVVNIHSFRAYFHTKASDKHGVEYANALDGHSGYLPQYYRKSPEEKARMYLELEPDLYVESIKPEVEKTKDMIISDLQIKMQKLEDESKRNTELLKKLRP